MLQENKSNIHDPLIKAIYQKRQNALIFCSSYTCVKTILYILEKYNWYKDRTLIISGTTDLFNFFSNIVNQNFDNTKVIYIPNNYNSNSSFLSIPYKIISSRIKNRILAKSINSNNEISDVFFSSKEYTSNAFYFLNKMIKKNTIIHIPDPGCDVYNMSDRKPKGLKERIKLIIIKLLYGRHLVYGYSGKEINFPLFTKINESYCKKNIDIKISVNERINMLNNFNLNKYYSLGKKTYKILYFDKDFVRDGLCKEYEYQQEIEEIFNTLSEFVSSNEVGKKYKPAKSSMHNKERIKFGEIINDFYPAETLYHNDVKIYLGMTSHALANIEKGNVISMVKLITYLDPIKRERHIENQELRKKTKIYYPNSINELRILIQRFLS